MTEVFSKFVFSQPQQTAVNKFELETAVAQFQAFNILQTASLEPEWWTADQLRNVKEADLQHIYVLHEFIGFVYNHLASLGCRVVGPLVVIQSHSYSLTFPMRKVPTWAQSLNGKLITGISFNVDDECDICEKVIKLGGIYKKTISDQSSMIIVGGINPDDAWYQDAVSKQMTILRKDWLDEVYKAAFELQWDSKKFFENAVLSQYSFGAPPALEPTIEQIQDLTNTPKSPSHTVLTDSPHLSSILNNSAPRSFNRTIHQSVNPMSQRSIHPLPDQPITTESQQLVHPLPDQTITIASQRSTHSSLNRSAHLPANQSSVSNRLSSPPTDDSTILQETTRSRLNTSNLASSMQPPSLEFGLSPIRRSGSRNRTFSSMPLQSTNRQPVRESPLGPLPRRRTIHLQQTQTKLEISTRPSTQSSSVEYISQGPVMASAGPASATQQRAVVWEDRHAKTSQMDSSFLRTHTQEQLDHFATDKENRHQNQADSNAATTGNGDQKSGDAGVYMDDEERKLLESLFGS